MIYVNQKIEKFTYSNIEASVAEYDKEAEYAVGDIVRVGNNQYKSTLEANTGNDPLLTLYLYWVYWAPSNEFAMLDLLKDTKTEWTENGIVEFKRGFKDTIGIGNFKATTITIEYLDDEDAVLETEVYDFSQTNNSVDDSYTILYGGFISYGEDLVYANLLRVGVTVRVTFEDSGADTNCGYMIAGVASYMGDTLDKVEFPYRRVGTRTIDEATFRTTVDKNQLSAKKNEANAIAEQPLLFIIDPSVDSDFNNIVILGSIQSVSATAEVAEKNQLSWVITQNIEE